MTPEAQRLVEELRDACMKIRVKASIPLSALIPIMQRAADEIDQLASMIPAGGLAEEARDAARYRWLRANREEQTAKGTMVDVYDEDGVLLWYNYLDAAIDAAMAASTPRGQEKTR